MVARSGGHVRAGHLISHSPSLALWSGRDIKQPAPIFSLAALKDPESPSIALKSLSPPRLTLPTSLTLTSLHHQRAVCRTATTNPSTTNPSTTHRPPTHPEQHRLTAGRTRRSAGATSTHHQKMTTNTLADGRGAVTSGEPLGPPSCSTAVCQADTSHGRAMWKVLVNIQKLRLGWWTAYSELEALRSSAQHWLTECTRLYKDWQGAYSCPKDMSSIMLTQPLWGVPTQDFWGTRPKRDAQPLEYLCAQGDLDTAVRLIRVLEGTEAWSTTALFDQILNATPTSVFCQSHSLLDLLLLPVLSREKWQDSKDVQAEHLQRGADTAAQKGGVEALLHIVTLMEAVDPSRSKEESANAILQALRIRFQEQGSAELGAATPFVFRHLSHLQDCLAGKPTEAGFHLVTFACQHNWIDALRWLLSKSTMKQLSKGFGTRLVSKKTGIPCSGTLLDIALCFSTDATVTAILEMAMDRYMDGDCEGPFPFDVSKTRKNGHSAFVLSLPRRGHKW